MEEKFYNPNQCMGFMTYTANRLLVSALSKHMNELNLDLSPEQWGLLMQFWNRGDIAQEEAAQVASIDKSTASRSLKAMENRGLIKRRLDPEDARKKILSLTEKAETLKYDSLKAVKATLSEALDGIDPKECAICLKVLGLIKENLQNIKK